jgi:hypothetical protein
MDLHFTYNELRRIKKGNIFYLVINSVFYKVEYRGINYEHGLFYFEFLEVERDNLKIPKDKIESYPIFTSEPLAIRYRNRIRKYKTYKEQREKEFYSYMGTPQHMELNFK